MRRTSLLALLILAACGDEGGSKDASVSDADASAPTGLGIDYGSDPAAATPRYEPTSREFTATPWPTNRLLTQGFPDLTTFPNPNASELINAYETYGAEALDGWGRNAAIYFQLSASIDTTSLPSADTSRRDPRAVVQLIDVSEGSAHYGERWPLAFQQHTPSDLPDPFYLGTTLALRPVYGFPLEDARTYCAVLTRAVKDSGGRYLGVADAFTDALSNEPSLAPLRAWLGDSGTPLAAHDIAAATCFTTQDATKDMRNIEAFLETRATTAPHDLVYNGSTQFFHEFTGKYETPNFQSGTKPYTNEGGDLKLDENGLPIVQLDETIRFRLLISKTRDMPATGWPVILYSHGTFGDWSTCVGEEGRPASEAEAVRGGLAMICIDQPLHGIRAADGVGENVSVLDVFNFVNPRSGRMTFRQSAIDTMWLSRMVQDHRFDIPAGTTSYTKDVTIDPNIITYFGHSHGGLAGAIVLAIDPRLKGAVLSGASGVLVETVLRRTDPVDLKSTVAAVIGLEPSQLDTFHPIMSLAQTLVEATDPVNYAPYWLEPVTGGNSKHVFMTEGTKDPFSPAVGADAVAAAAGIPLINPIEHDSEAHALKGLEAVNTPVQANLTSTTGQIVTGGIRQFADGDHFVALENDEAIQLWRGFFRAFVLGDVPAIDPDPDL